jgi:phage terminase small subunit
MEKRISRVEIRQDAIISELAALAFSDIRHVMSWNSKGIKLHRSDTLSAAAAASIAEVSCIDTLNGRNVKVKTYDKVRALELLARHFGMLTDRMELDAKVVRTDEQKYHVIQEIISQPDVVDRVRENFRLRFRDEFGEERL